MCKCLCDAPLWCPLATQECYCWLLWQSCFQVFEGPPHTDFCADSLHSRQQRLLFVPIAARVSVICFLDDCRSDWGEMKSQYSFNLHLRWRGWLNICFSCLSAICILYLENSLQLHSPFIDWEVGRLVVEVFKLLWLLQMRVLHPSDRTQAKMFSCIL